jgi:mycothiol synthase
MLAWAEKEAETAYRRLGPDHQTGTLNKMWVSSEDAAQIRHLEGRGFHAAQWDCSFRRSLAGAIPAPILLAGYHLRLCRGLDELANRAPAQYGAFNNKMPWEKYLRRFDYFMRSEAYASALDVVAVAADGRIAAFCIAWPDAVTREGHFEPIGTAPDFQRLGLGQAVLCEAMLRLQAAEMTQVSVVTPEENLPAVALYRSVGFETIGKLGRFVREIERLP